MLRTGARSNAKGLIVFMSYSAAGLSDSPISLQDKLKKEYEGEPSHWYHTVVTIWPVDEVQHMPEGQYITCTLISNKTDWKAHSKIPGNISLRL